LDIPGLILITDSTCLDGERLMAAAEAALKGGVDAVLVREKHLTSARLLALSAQLRTLTRDYGSRLIIHTQADVARAVGADGVHVAADAISEITAIRRWLSETRMMLSASCHNRHELDAAAVNGADFALLSPVFPTQSHAGAPHLGVDGFLAMARHAQIPVVALGGITVENRQMLAGYGVAAISAFLGATDPEAVASAFARGLNVSQT